MVLGWVALGCRAQHKSKSICVSEILAAYRGEDSGCSLRVVFTVIFAGPCAIW